MKTCNRRHEAAVEAIANRLLGAPPVSLEPIATYPDSIVYRLIDGDTTLVFKGHDPDGRDRDGIAAEGSALQQTKAAGVPAPDVIELDTSGSVFPGSYVVMTSAEGVPLNTLEPRDVERFAPAIGETLRRLHSVTVPDGTVSWRDFVWTPVPAAVDYLSRLPPGDIDASRLRQGVDRASLEIEEPAKNVLLHGDLGENHVFVDPERGEITSVIDFGETAAGLWLWDLLEFHRPLLPLILDGYGVAAGEREEINHLVVTYALLKAVAWAAKWHARGEPEVLAWLRRTLEMFGETGA